MSQVGAFFSSINPGGAVLTLTGNNSGVQVGPTLGNINVVGTGLITVTGNAATHTLTISSAGATADQFDGDTGSAIPVAGVLNIVGSSNMHTFASGNSVEVILDDDVSISGSFTAGTTLGFIRAVTGDISADAGNFNLPTTLSTGDEGVITINALPFIQNFAGNVFIGTNAGNFTLTPGVAIENTVVGNSALSAATTANNNCVFGFDAMLSATTANNNCVFGVDGLVGLTTGNNNLSLGTSSGNAFLTSESNNILIGSNGVVGDNNTIRIGKNGSGPFEQDACFIAGIYGVTVTNAPELVTIDSTNKLGTISLDTFASTYATDSGIASPIGGIIDILGGLNINTAGATNVLTINLNDDVTISGTYTTTGGNIVVPSTNASGTAGIYEVNGNRFLHSFGTDNIFLGSNSGNLSFTPGAANSNIGIGTNTLQNLTTGDVCVAIGTGCLQNVDTGSASVAIGYMCGNSIASGGANTLIGYNICAAANAAASNIVAVGSSSLQAYTGVGNNISIGTECLLNLTTGVGNLVIGNLGNGGATYTTSESNNILIGSSGVISDNNTIRIGQQGSASLQQNKCFIAGIVGNTVSNTQMVTIDSTTGQLGVTSGGGGGASTFNTDAGTATESAGAITIAGGSNINTSGTAATVTVNLDNTVSISGSMTAGTGLTATTGDITATAGNIIVPFANSTSTEGLIQSGSGTSNMLFMNDNGNGTNIFLKSAGTVATDTYGDNIGIGDLSLSSLTSGRVNVAIGISSCQGLTSGNENVCLGPQSGQFIDSGSNNICIGEQAGRIMQYGINNISIGQSSLVNFIGANTGQNDSNIAIGFESLKQLASGIYNTCLGNGAGSNYTTTENNNIILGCQNGTATENNVIRIGNVASGAYPSVSTSTSCFIQGISGVTVTGSAVLCSTSGQLGTISSSIKFKENIKDIADKSKDIYNLRPVYFNYKKDESKTTHYGLIAEEVKNVFPDLVLYDETAQPSSVAYHELPVLLLNEIKNLREELDELKKKLLIN